MEEALGSVRCSHSSLQRPDKLRTSMEQQQLSLNARQAVQDLFSSPCWGSWYFALVQQDTKIILYLKLHSISFGPISQVLCSFQIKLQQLPASLFLLDFTLVCVCPGLTVANLRVLFLILSSTILLQFLELSLPGRSWIQGFGAPECLVFQWDLGWDSS